MFRSPHTIRLIKALALTAALTAVLVPAAQAADKSDAVDRALRNNSAPLDVRSPDRKSPARHWAQPDAVDRLVTNTGTRPQQVDFRSADTRDAAAGRYPEGLPTLVAVPGGFDWGDATFGAGMTAAALLLAGAIAIGIRHHKRVVLS